MDLALLYTNHVQVHFLAILLARTQTWGPFKYIDLLNKFYM